MQGNAYCCCRVVMRPSLQSWKDRPIDLACKLRILIQPFLSDHDNPSPRAPKSLVGGRRNDMRIRRRALVDACDDKTGYMGDIRGKIGAYAVRDFAQFLKRKLPYIGR